jgi:hypothetical protein
MKARYRLVHFIPDPFLGGRVPIAAIVDRGSGSIDIARIPHIPGPACLGGLATSAVVQIILEDLESATHFDRLPLTVGPQVVFGRPWDIPHGVEDPISWIQSNLYARSTVQKHDKEHRAPNRSTFGYRFFENYHVSEYVRKSFHPGTDANGFLPNAAVLRPISHYVDGRNELLLMEPIVPRRSVWHADVSTIATTFGAYKTALRHEHSRIKTRLTAYVLAGSAKDDLHSIMSELMPFADEVIDTADPHARAKFVAQIRDVGRSRDASLLH